MIEMLLLFQLLRILVNVTVVYCTATFFGDTATAAFTFKICGGSIFYNATASALLSLLFMFLSSRSIFGRLTIMSGANRYFTRLSTSTGGGGHSAQCM